MSTSRFAGAALITALGSYAILAGANEGIETHAPPPGNEREHAAVASADKQLRDARLVHELIGDTKLRVQIAGARGQASAELTKARSLVTIR